MYKLEITQGNNTISCTDTDIEALTSFIYENVDLFGPETKFSISEVQVSK